MRPRLRLRAAVALALAVAAAFTASAPVAQAYLYWTDNGPGTESTGTTIGRGNLDGSGVASSLVGTSPGPGGIVSDGSHIYWANDNAGVYSIGRANPDGSGANPTFISGAATSGGTFAVATDGTYLYWTDSKSDGNVGRANLDGTGARANFINVGQAAFGIAVYAGVLYIGEFQQIVRVPASGTSAPSVFRPISGQVAGSLAATGGYVYWTENLGGVIGRAPVTGTGVNESYVTGLQYPTGLATDGNELYWVDHGAGTIGRATIGATGAGNIQPNFISDPGGPLGLALDSAIDPTRTSVTCNPPTLAVSSVSACTALVSDSASTSIPTGSIVFSGGGSTYFSGGNSCTVAPRPGGGASCTVGAASSALGVQGLTAAYSGDAVHSPSSGAGQFCAGTATVCGGGTGTGGTGGGTGTTGGKPPACKVPKLKGKTLATARTLLARAHCRLGKVVTPRARKGHKRGHLVVGSERPGAGKLLANGAKVEVRLVARSA